MTWHKHEMTALEFARAIVLLTAGYAAWSAYTIPRVEPPILVARFDDGWAILLGIGAALAVVVSIHWTKRLAATAFALIMSCLLFRGLSFLVADGLTTNRRMSGLGVWIFPAGLIALVWVHVVLPIQSIRKR